MADKITRSTHIVCLGGGIGTANLIRGLKEHTTNITVIVSAADDGGSAGRLRRLYNVFPPGDAISCLAALLPEKHDAYGKLLTYRFPGNRYADPKMLAGHKVGNLLFVAAVKVTGSTHKALRLLEALFGIPGKILPATTIPLSLSGITVDNVTVTGEQAIDLGEYKGRRELQRVFIHPAKPSVLPEVSQALKKADVLIAGPGDLYTTILPVLLVPAIAKALLSSRAKKLFVVNVANKPHETKGYVVEDYIAAIAKHLGAFPFTRVLVNSNIDIPIPKTYRYDYVASAGNSQRQNYEVSFHDLVHRDFPLYHDSQKLARAIVEHIRSK